MLSLARRLSAVPLFEHLDQERLGWLADVGETLEHPAGTVLARQGDAPDGFWVILAGDVRWTRRVGGREVYAVTLGPGDVFAELILILDTPYPTTGTTSAPTTTYRLSPDAFWTMIATCRGVLRKVTRVAVERAEVHETITQQQARLVGLGQVAAGLAHELGNPAASLQRAVTDLVGQLETAGHAAPPSPGASQLGALERADRIEELCLRLEADGVEDADELAAALVDAGDVPGDRSSEELVSVARALRVRALAADALAATRQITALVEATKTTTAMDSPADRAPVEPGTVVAAAIAMIGAAGVRVDVAPDVPRVLGVAGDLGQLVIELLRNAHQGGIHIDVTVTTQGSSVVLIVEDDGPGVAPDAADRIFEPFFTTRGAGGVGLGLTRARQIAEQHDGTLVHEGGARFVLRLPVAP